MKDRILSGIIAVILLAGAIFGGMKWYEKEFVEVVKTGVVSSSDDTTEIDTTVSAVTSKTLEAYRGEVEKQISASGGFLLSEHSVNGYNWFFVGFPAQGYDIEKHGTPTELYCGLYGAYSECSFFVKGNGSDLVIDNVRGGDIELVEKNNQTLLLNTYGDGDSCVRFDNAELYLPDGTLDTRLIYDASACEHKIDSYILGDYKITFRLQDTNITTTKATEIIFSKKSLDASWQDYSVLYENDFTYEFDINKNILSDKKGFVYMIDNTEQEISFSEIDALFRGQVNSSNLSSFYAHLATTGSGTYSIEFEEYWKELIQKIEVLSCKDNSSVYDSEYYTLKKYQPGDTKFKYNLAEKWGNLCTNPYKLKVTYVDDEGSADLKTTELLYELKFNK